MNKLILLFFTFILYGVNLENEDKSVLSIAKQYLDIPYVANTLEVSNDERLVINKQEVDCTTFVEYVLAEYLTNDIVSFEERLQSLRYREGIINGFASRLHYFSEWIQQAINNEYLIDITEKNSSFSERLALNFMSSHPDSYEGLKNGKKEALNDIKQTEERLSGEVFHYLPKDQLPDTGLDWIENGDIIALTTTIKGLDVSHLGFAIYINDELRLLHASSVQKKVVIDSNSLRKRLMKNKRNQGVRVFRVQR